jgi:hypothetical protein
MNNTELTSSICESTTDTGAKSSFTIAKQKLSEWFETFTPREWTRCMNVNCCEETENAILYIWEAHSHAYEHTRGIRQDPLNTTKIIVNGKPYLVRCCYCCECFKKHILVGDNKNVSQHYGDYYYGGQQVNVSFNEDYCPSTWYNLETQQVEPLNKFQENMLKISSFTFAKQKLTEQLGVFTPRFKWCINKYCADDTEDIVEHVWNYHYPRYIHHTQFALNETTIVINEKSYDFNSHYCCECLKKYVLVGDNKNASHHYGDYCKNYNQQVNVTYNKEPTPSTWTNPKTEQKELLNEWQLMAVNGNYAY